MSSLPSSSNPRHQYDVFLSFRGEDTRLKFTGHLYNALVGKGIVTFIDDRGLLAGKEIAPALSEAIRESWCSVIVFSETYACSGWCLEELAEIVKRRKVKEHKIFPIFYEVDPSDLRKQTGKVKEAFEKHEERYEEDKIQKWRTALTEVANISGWNSKDKAEAEFIKDIVEMIYKVVPPMFTGPLFYSKDFRPSESSNLTFSQIVSSLNTNGVNMIGLYGMPGVGKTTLVKQVMKHALQQKLFDNVVMVTMSQTPNFYKIRDSIAGSLRIKLGEGTEEEKTGELWYGLEDVKKILIIIDDVWKEFELHSLGIPFDVEHGGCKILMTTRLQQVCVKMDCQEKFQLDVLPESEAWALFKEKAGLKDESSELNDVAKEIASECKGLPLAIVTIGKALKGESLDGWTIANDRLKESRHLDNEDVCDDLYNSLQLSYEYLKVDNIRSCFLLCSLFQEDVDFGFEELIMLGIGHGLFSNVKLFEKVRKEIYVALEKLLKSGLLLESDKDRYDDNERYVRMHDVIRDFAHWKTLREKNAFMVKQGLTEWPNESFECCAAISFWESSIEYFPQNLEFPKLKIFIFEGNTLVKIPSAFIKGMKALRVLRLKNVIFSMKELKFVTNLRTLCFEDCKLKSISSLRNLENLEILALWNTNIIELPEALVTLRALKSLHFFSDTKRLDFPPNLVSRLTSLQELHMRCRNNLYLTELNSLSGLSELQLGVSEYQYFEFPKLQRYNIVVNQNPIFRQGTTFITLRVRDFSTLLSAFKELFLNVEKLSLMRDINGINEWLIDTTGEKRPTTSFSNLVGLTIVEMPCLKELCHGPPPIRFLQNLKYMTIGRCKELKVLFLADMHPAKEGMSLSNLTSLDLEHLPELECIWKLQSTHPYNASLPSLQYVSIMYCNKLKSIFSTCIAQSLLNLQELNISNCDGLEQVFDFPQEMAELEIFSCEEKRILPLSNLTIIHLTRLSKLRCILKGPTHFFNLQSLKEVIIHYCHELKSIFPTCVAQSLVHLQELDIAECDGLEQLFYFPQERVELECPIQGATLPNLRHLKVDDCKRLKFLFSQSLAQNLRQLTSLFVRQCNELEAIIKVDNQTSTVSTSSSSQGHTHLQPVSFPSLESIRIRGCRDLKNLFPTSVAQSLSKLRYCNISLASKIEHFFGYQGEVLNIEDDQKGIVFPELGTLELSALPSLKSFVPMDYHFWFPSLVQLTVGGCPNSITSFSIDTNDIVHAITKAPVLVETNTTEGFITMEERIENRLACDVIFWHRDDGRDTLPIIDEGTESLMLTNDGETYQRKRKYES